MKRIVLAFLPFLLAAGPLQAQPCCGAMRGAEAGPRGPRLDRLELTDTQEKQVEELRLAHQKKMVQIRSKIEDARIDLRSLMNADKPDRVAIEKTLGTISDQEHQMKLAWTGHWFNVNALLTPKQQEIWRDGLGKGSGGRSERQACRRCERGRRHGWQGN